MAYLHHNLRKGDRVEITAHEMSGVIGSLGTVWHVDAIGRLIFEDDDGMRWNLTAHQVRRIDDELLDIPKYLRRFDD